MQNPSIKLSHSPKKTNPSPDAKPNKKNILHVYVLSNKCGITCMHGFLQLVKLSRARFILEKSKQKKNQIPHPQLVHLLAHSSNEIGLLQ